MGGINVLIVDDSALVRSVIQEILSSDSSISSIETAADPYIAAHKINKNPPDVITLDVEMPRMDGLTFLKKIMSQHPIPVVVISTLTKKGTQIALDALEYGAVEVLAKPTLNTKKRLNEESSQICDAVKAAANARIKRRKQHVPVAPDPKYTADAMLSKSTPKRPFETTDKLIAVGASTGGTEAIRQFLLNMPLNCPGIVIVQHMPDLFTKQFAERLDGICSITVKEAKHGDAILNGQALIAPGNKHMLLKRSGAKYYVDIKDGPLVNRHKPSVDVLFRSTARYAGANAVGVIMTGMGSDGARGLLEMKEAGAYTIAQDEESCIVFGMPKEAIKINASMSVLPLNQMAQRCLEIIQ